MLVRGKRVPSAALAVKLHAITGVPLKGLLARKVQPARARGDPPSRHASPSP
jgi:hypothetical protein